MPSISTKIADDDIQFEYFEDCETFKILITHSNKSYILETTFSESEFKKDNKCITDYDLFLIIIEKILNGRYIGAHFTVYNTLLTFEVQFKLFGSEGTFIFNLNEVGCDSISNTNDSSNQDKQIDEYEKKINELNITINKLSERINKTQYLPADDVVTTTHSFTTQDIADMQDYIKNLLRIKVDNSHCYSNCDVIARWMSDKNIYLSASSLSLQYCNNEERVPRFRVGNIGSILPNNNYITMTKNNNYKYLVNFLMFYLTYKSERGYNFLPQNSRISYRENKLNVPRDPNITEFVFQFVKNNDVKYVYFDEKKDGCFVVPIRYLNFTAYTSREILIELYCEKVTS